MASHDQAAKPAARPPGDFIAVLAAAEPQLLVGGQAVNLWALHYRTRTAGLEPFVSQDIDVLGDRQTLRHIAVAAKAKAHFFPMRPPTNEVGVVIAAGPDGRPMPVEVLSHVHGVSNQELLHPVYTMIMDESGLKVRVPGPVALLRAKIANVADLAQDGRQDARHVRILFALMPAYLADLHAAVAADRLTEKEMLALLERLLAAATTAKAGRVWRELKLAPAMMLAELATPPGTKLHSFIARRLPRIFGTQSA